MFRIIYSDSVNQKITDFIKSYRSTFENLYFDTGLFNLDVIINSYIAKWNSLEKEIIIKLEKILYENEIFWYKLTNWQKSIKIFLKSFMLEIFYEEDFEEKIRFIEKIIINKK